jgi:hypothetical protein
MVAIAILKITNKQTNKQTKRHFALYTFYIDGIN